MHVYRNLSPTYRQDRDFNVLFVPEIRMYTLRMTNIFLHKIKIYKMDRNELVHFYFRNQFRYKFF